VAYDFGCRALYNLPWRARNVLQLVRKNVLLQLVRDITPTEYVTSVMKNVLNKKKIVEMAIFVLQKKIWKRNLERETIETTV